MNALLFENEPQLVVLPRPERGPNEALVRVLAAGICQTDLEILKGYMGFSGVLGHEFVGLVEEAENPVLLGKRVVGEINCPCGSCPYCQLELPHHCTHRTVLGIEGRDGAFAEYVTLPETNLHLVPDAVPDDVAVFVEPVAAAFRILEQVDVTRDNRVIVLGDGRLGQLIAQVLSLRTENVIVVGRHRWKLDLLERHGIRAAHASEPVEPGADIVVDATGSHEGFGRALQLVRPEGTIVLKTTVTHPTALDFSIPVINEVRIIGSRCGPFRPALDALAMGTVNVTPLVTETYGIKDGVHALQRATAPDVMKVLIYP